MSNLTWTATWAIGLAVYAVRFAIQIMVSHPSREPCSVPITCLFHNSNVFGTRTTRPAQRRECTTCWTGVESPLLPLPLYRLDLYNLSTSEINATRLGL